MEADAGRVLVHVVARGDEVFVGVDHPGVETALEEMADSVVPPVEALSVESVQPLHPGREIGLRRLEHEVEVVVEQDPRVQDPAEASSRVGERSLPPAAVNIVEHDPPPFDTS